MKDRREVEIEFLGLFDTVEAFGVPIEELRTAIDWAIWPISFRNRRLSHKVKRARHALSLDDERTSFHPIRFDQSNPRDGDQIKEVWFAGVHSDVGGGYPDGTLSYVPLLWMAEQVAKDLRFQPGSGDHFKAYQLAIGPMHDSRSGTAVMYRYGPRLIGEDEKVDGGPPVIHLAVVERMLHGCDSYAPVTLPAGAKVLLPDGQVLPLTEHATREAMKSAYEASPKGKEAPATAAEAFVKMSPPDENMVELVLDTVWWRQFAYYSLLLAIGLLAAWPWIAKPVVTFLRGPTKEVTVGNATALDLVSYADDGLGSVFRSVADLLKSFLPSYAEYWLKIADIYPVLTTAVIALAGIAWNRNAFLRDRVQERARLAWNRPHRMPPDVGNGSRLLKIGRLTRLYAWPLRMGFTKIVVPGVFLTAIFSVALLAVGRINFNWSAGVGNLCKTSGSLTAVGEHPLTASPLFDISNGCWASGLWVEKGHRYRIWIEVKDPWFDRTVMSGANGFQTNDILYLAALPIRRLYRADWFQPVARIGKDGYTELPLEAINAMPADGLPRPRNPSDPKDEHTYPVALEDTDEFKDQNGELRRNWRELGWFDPIPKAALPAARDVWQKQGLARLMVADFIAPEFGELFLYVNDAIQVFPFLGPFERFYKNNSGTASVSLQRLPPPPLGG